MLFRRGAAAVSPSRRTYEAFLFRRASPDIPFIERRALAALKIRYFHRRRILIRHYHAALMPFIFMRCRFIAAELRVEARFADFRVDYSVYKCHAYIGSLLRFMVGLCRAPTGAPRAADWLDLRAHTFSVESWPR